MMIRICTVSLLFVFALRGHSQSDVQKGLKDYYADYFPIGVSISPGTLHSPDSIILLREFNSITPENVMKPENIHPHEDEYHWLYADRIAQFASRHGLLMRGHTLCWHQQTGDWMFQDERGGQVSKEVLLRRLHDHIFQVAGHYKDMIYAWDVVNEAVSDKKGRLLRNTKWYDICGEDFIYKAFEYAHEAAPDALLFYNDYNAIIPEKRERIVKLLKQLIDRGVPIHGFGIQGHWNIYNTNEKDLRDALDAYGSLGLQVQITELDISVYPWEKARRELRAGESDELSPELAQKQKEVYEMVFRVFREYKDLITGVTFWNVTDNTSWLNTYPVRGRRNYPLLFDRDGNRKEAYSVVVDFE